MSGHVHVVVRAWRFVEGAPEDVIFDLAYERRRDPDYLEYFQAAGWSHVLSAGDLHIFKAAPGTPPVHTSAETRREELVRERSRYLVYSLVALAVFAGVVIAVAIADWSAWLEMLLLVIALIPVVYTVLPLAGYWYRSRSLPRRP